ncbi:hypothetical protein M404DRAFT_27903 [Pisolithus tinctorius Marx 270]|uniref:Golgi apparatus membrane protein TVP23 n=1 Tax=Pisolithus tinctorius Marx 270 TaxID=870435 RepID=A0A0C3P4T1_PISTI|nr:hypothetical protein M404DRAFT_27903 [Pisolithus tinctorius Marx 270]
MSTQAVPLLQTIEPDDPSAENVHKPNAAPQQRQNLAASSTMASNHNDAESALSGILKQAENKPWIVSAHPAVLLCLYFFRVSAISVYVLCGLFTDNYVLSTVVVVVLLAMDFWNCRNVAGRRLVGLRFWNQIDEDGESYWVFESRDVGLLLFFLAAFSEYSPPCVPFLTKNTHSDLEPDTHFPSRMFWIAIYVFPVCWLLLFVISIVRFNLSFIPIVVLALVFNITNAVGFTYADRDAKQRGIASSAWNVGIGGQIVSGVVRNSIGKIFG